jgi:hypothetical protein
MPKGWHNEVYLHKPYGLNRPLANTSSPDKEISIYLSDADLPLFLPPDSMANPSNQWLVSMNPMYRVSAFVPAEFFFRDYLQYKFGNLPGFRITRIGACPAYHQHLVESARQHGANVYTTTVGIWFEYQVNGQWMHCYINASTVATASLWIADLYAVYTKGQHPEQYTSIALQMLSSLRNTPQWQQRQRAMHQQQMAGMYMSEQTLRSNHQQNMANLQMQQESHQQRMQTMQEGYRASSQQWTESQLRQEHAYKAGSSDYTHEQFINTILEEHTVIDGQGNTFQVDNKHERYFVNKADGTYIGTDKVTELSDLARITGIDIRNFEEVKIIR